MQLKEMDESLALAEDAAVTGNDNIVFFCYTPHHMFALHELVILKEPAHDPQNETANEGADWLDVSEAGVAGDTAYLHIHYASEPNQAIQKQPNCSAMPSLTQTRFPR